MIMQSTLKIRPSLCDPLIVEDPAHNLHRPFRGLTLAAATPAIRVGDIAANEKAIVSLIAEAVGSGVDVLLFSDMALTGSTCGDLLRQDALLSACPESLGRIARATAASSIRVLLSVPLRSDRGLMKVTAVMARGAVEGVIPVRWLSPHGQHSRDTLRTSLLPFPVMDRSPAIPALAIQLAPVDPVNIGGFDGYEEYPDIAPVDPQGSAWPVLEVAADARHEWTGDYRRLRSALIRGSLCRHSLFLYAGAGEGESVSEGVFAGHRLILCDGRILSESPAFSTGLTTAVIQPEDIGHILSSSSTVWEFSGSEALHLKEKSVEENRRFPFLMKKELDAVTFYRETMEILGRGLAARLAAIGARPVLGLSGGLDSSLALLICMEAARINGFSHREILAVSMPGPGTSRQSRSLTRQLGEATHVGFREISIEDAVSRHLRAIGHNGTAHDVTFENAQARERTQILMDLANLGHGLVVGTGDLSELALGWCTYNGDQMSMYAVNASIPKTAVRYLVGTAAERLEEGKADMGLSPRDAAEAASALRRILSRPVSPELLPPHEDDSLRQITEDVIGPYELIDFFLWHMVFGHKKPSAVYDLAAEVFGGIYRPPLIAQWLRGFILRFFRSQFKRSAAPEGVAAFPWRLTPQSAWRMPGDARPDLWLDELSRHTENY